MVMEATECITSALKDTALGSAQVVTDALEALRMISDRGDDAITYLVVVRNLWTKDDSSNGPVTFRSKKSPGYAITKAIDKHYRSKGYSASSVEVIATVGQFKFRLPEPMVSEVARTHPHFGEGL